MLRRMHRRAMAVSLLALAVLPFGGCSSGTETGNPSFQAELSYAAYSSAPLAVAVRNSGAEVTVDSAWLDLDRVALFRAGTCDQAEPSGESVPALGIGDHAAGKHNATLFASAAGAYCGLELPFVLVPPGSTVGDQPRSLEQHSIMLSGTLGDGTPFSLLSAATPRLHLLADSGDFEISEERPQTLIAFDVAAWFANLDWGSATPQGGAISISADQNTGLLAQFEANLASGVALYRDSDGDGKLDATPERLAH